MLFRSHSSPSQVKKHPASNGVKDEKQAILELLRLTSCRASFLFIRDEVPLENINWKKTILGSHMAGVFHPLQSEALGGHSFLNPYLSLLQKARGSGSDALSGAVAAVTANPAHLYDMPHRGEIREGYFADIVTFKDDIEHTLVNGVVVGNDAQKQ